MISSSAMAAQPKTRDGLRHERLPLEHLALLIALALALRLITYNGALGSDDLTYFGSARQLVEGNWTASDYNGALRYGFNLPAAGFMSVFGVNLFVANLWPLLCSLVEIIAIYVLVFTIAGTRAGLYAGALLATAPLHVAVATRIHADSVVSMFVTLAFVLLYFAASRRSTLLAFLAGLCLGGIFWTKELVAVAWFAYLPMIWLFRHQWRSCVYVVGGLLLMLAAHGILMMALTGDPLHLIRVVLSAVGRNFIDGGQGEDSAAFYLRYLFLDLRHVGFLGFFAVLSIVLARRKVGINGVGTAGYYFILTWWIALLVVLSLFPVSLSPLRFTMKQSNYITLFLAPTAALAGIAVNALSRKLRLTALMACLSIAVVFAFLQQADYRAFTANSKAVGVFAVGKSDTLIVGSSNNSSLGNRWAAMNFPGEPRALIMDFKEVGLAGVSTSAAQPATVFAVLDKQTMNWMAGSAPVTQALPCWRFYETLAPQDLGLGNKLAWYAARALAPVAPAAGALQRLAQPQPAEVYTVDGSDALCRG